MAMSDIQASLKIEGNNITINSGNDDSTTLHIEHKELKNNIPWIDVVPYYLALYALGNPNKEEELNASLQSCDETINFDKFVQHFINENDAYAYFKVLQISLFFAPLLLENQRNINFKNFLTFYVKKICNLFLLFKNVIQQENSLITEILELIQNDNPIYFIKHAKEDSQIIDYLTKLANTFRDFDKNIMDFNEIKKIAKNLPDELPKNFSLDENVKNMLTEINFDMFDPKNDIIMYNIYNKFYNHYTNTLKNLNIQNTLSNNNIEINESLKNFYKAFTPEQKVIYEYLYNLRRHKCKKLIESAQKQFLQSVKLVKKKESKGATNLSPLIVNPDTVKLAQKRVEKAQKAVETSLANVDGKDTFKIKKDQKKAKEKLRKAEKKLRKAEELKKQENDTSSSLSTPAKIALGTTAAAATAGVLYATGAGSKIYNAVTGAASSLKSALTGSPVSSGTGGAANVANAGVYTRDLGTEGAANVGNVAGFKGTRPSDTSTTTFETPDGRIVNVKVNCNVNKELIKAKLKAQQLKERLREMEYNYEELVGKSEQCFGEQDEYSQKKATAAMAAKIRRASLSKERQKLKKRNLSPKDCIEELARARARLRNLGKRP
jgi:hypothetical protein